MAKELYLLRDELDELENIVVVDVLTNPKTPINDFTVSVNHMGDNKLTAKFYYPHRINFTLSEYVIYDKEGDYEIGDPQATEKYYLITPPTWRKDEKSLMLEYDCTFVAKQEILKFVPMIDTWEGIADGDTPKKPSLYQTEYSFFGGVEAYAMNIKSSMISEFGLRTVDSDRQPVGWTLNVDLTNGYEQIGNDMQIYISNMDVFAALQDIYEKFKVPFFINNTEITIGGLKNYVDYRFRYGKGNGLYKITKSVQSDDIITKIRGVGSERNIPYTYLQNEKRLAGLTPLPMSRLMPFIYRQTLEDAAADPAKLSAVKEYYIAEDEYNSETPRMAFETYDDIYPTIHNAEYISPSGGGRVDNRIDKIVGVYFESSAVNIENETVVKGDNEEVLNPRFWIKVPPLGFDIRECLNEKDKLVLSPANGYCGGCRFDVLSVGSKNDKWQGYNARAYLQLVKMNGKQIINELSTTNTLEERTVVKSAFTNEVYLPFETKIEWNIPVSFDFNKRHASTGVNSAEVEIELYKDGVLLESLETISATRINAGKESLDDVLEGDYTVEDSGNYKIRYVTTVVVHDVTLDGLRGFSRIGFPNFLPNQSFEILCTYIVPVENFNDTTNESQWLLVQKDLDTYNTLMPFPSEPLWTLFVSPDDWNPTAVDYQPPVGIVPQIDDEFVFLGITLPKKYIIEAEKRLETALLLQLNENKAHKYKYDCGFDEKMLLENPSINSDIKIGSIVLISENTKPFELPEEEDYQEMTINSLVLKYSPDKITPSIT